MIPSPRPGARRVRRAAPRGRERAKYLNSPDTPLYTKAACSSRSTGRATHPAGRRGALRRGSSMPSAPPGGLQTAVATAALPDRERPRLVQRPAPESGVRVRRETRLRARRASSRAAAGTDVRRIRHGLRPQAFTSCFFQSRDPARPRAPWSDQAGWSTGSGADETRAQFGSLRHPPACARIVRAAPDSRARAGTSPSNTNTISRAAGPLHHRVLPRSGRCRGGDGGLQGPPGGPDGIEVALRRRAPRRPAGWRPRPGRARRSTPPSCTARGRAS